MKIEIIYVHNSGTVDTIGQKFLLQFQIFLNAVELLIRVLNYGLLHFQFSATEFDTGYIDNRV